MSLSVYKTSYQYDVPLDDFKKLLKLDYCDVVEPALKKAGAIDIEYDGHFGASIFFSTEKTEEANEVVKTIIELINK